MKKKMGRLERILCLILCGVFLACILYCIFYYPDETLYNISLGFRYGFIDYFKGSLWKSIIGICAIIIIALFCTYWTINMQEHKIKTLGPFYLIALFIIAIFANGYYNVMYEFDGLLALNFILMVNLIINMVVSFIIYIKNLERKR